MPNALKTCPKFNKSPNLVTLKTIYYAYVQALRHLLANLGMISPHTNWKIKNLLNFTSANNLSSFSKSRVFHRGINLCYFALSFRFVAKTLKNLFSISTFFSSCLVLVSLIYLNSSESTSFNWQHCWCQQQKVPISYLNGFNKPEAKVINKF